MARTRPGAAHVAQKGDSNSSACTQLARSEVKHYAAELGKLTLASERAEQRGRRNDLRDKTTKIQGHGSVPHTCSEFRR